MILYNITVIIDESIHDQWLQWIEAHHIPDILATGMFISSRLLKVLDSPNEGITYCMQFISEDLDKYNQYKDHFSTTLRTEHEKMFEGKFVSFRTLMEFIETR
jgi:hypothetical protein